MTNIVIFEDGKSARGSRAKLIKRGNKRVLIEFTKYDYENDVDIVVTEWFKVFIPSYTRCKKHYKHNNMRKHALYLHVETNEFYSDVWQMKDHAADMKKYGEKYFNRLYMNHPIMEHL